MTFLAEGASLNSSRCVLYSRLGEAGFLRVDGMILLKPLYGILPCMASGVDLPYAHPDPVGTNPSAFVYRPPNDLRTPDQVFRRHIADRVFHAAVGRVVAVIAQHEIMAGRDPIFL